MQDLKGIKKEVAQMSSLSLEMWQTAFGAFMEHDLDLLSEALEKENELNDMERQITQELAELSRYCIDRKEKSKAMIFSDIVAELELIGDYCKDILERVQIKIEEKLLFSDEAVKDYEELYRKTEAALKDVSEALDKDNAEPVKGLLTDREHIDSTIDTYRLRHNQRVIDGVCIPLACNMFLNMIDFTAAVYQHARKIAKDISKIKE